MYTVFIITEEFASGCYTCVIITLTLRAGLYKASITVAVGVGWYAGVVITSFYYFLRTTTP